MFRGVRLFCRIVFLGPLIPTSPRYKEEFLEKHMINMNIENFLVALEGFSTIIYRIPIVTLPHLLLFIHEDAASRRVST